MSRYKPQDPLPPAWRWGREKEYHELLQTVDKTEHPDYKDGDGRIWPCACPMCAARRLAKAEEVQP